MRIGMLAPIAWRVPPRHYGPWERVVSILTEGLVRRGVDVTLFATADSMTKARLVSVSPRPYEEDRTVDIKVMECLHISEVFEHADEFDIIHNHYDFQPLTYSRLVKTPVLTTIHGFSSPNILPVYRKYDDTVRYVSISDSDRSPDLHYTATVYHGLPLDEFPFSPAGQDYLLFFGRIHPEKGVVEAIRLAQEVDRPLIIAGIIQDQGYFDEQVAPHLDGTRVRYIGSVGPDERAGLLGGAAALLHLIHFDEPFGLSMVEAMACGTPVVALRRGSVPEVVRDGISGCIVDHPDEAARAVAMAASLDRRLVREYAEKHFSQERMVQDYIDIYGRILAEGSRTAYKRRSWSR